MRRVGLFLLLVAGGLRAQFFTVSPTFLDFGSVPVGCNGSLSFTITPSTSLSFILEPPGSPFSLQGTTNFTTQNPQTLTVQFAPSGPGSFSGFAVNIVARNQQGAQVQRASVFLGGAGVDVVLTPSTIDFGSVQVGSTSSQTVRFSTNPPSSTFNFQVSAVSSTPAFRSSAVSATGDAQITFAPSSASAVSATITFTLAGSSTPACPVTRTLSVRGTGIAVDLSINPSAIDFGNVEVNKTSQSKSAIVTNRSTVDFTGTAASGNVAFLFSPASFTLAAGASQSFDISFKPPATGPQTGTITFTLVAAGAGGFRTTLTLRLSGQGQTAAGLSVSPDTLDFGDVGVGLSAVRSARVSNPGGVDATVTASASAPFSVSTTSFSIVAGGSQLVNVGFAPSREGPVQGTATFAVGSVTKTVNLSGTGVASSLAFSFAAGLDSTPVAPGGTIPLPPTTVGSTNSVQFQINNAGTVPAIINSIGVTGTIFGPGGVPSLPATVASGGSLNFTIRFRPDTPGNADATLGIDGRSFTLMGTGLLAAAAITGAGVTVPPAQQRTVGVAIPQSYRTALNGRLTLTFSPNAVGGDEPAIQFATGGRGVNFTIPANSTVAMFAGAPQIGFQTGTVVGTIEFRAVFDVSGTDVSPSPIPTASVTIPRSAPVITSLAAARTGSGLQIVAVGYSANRDVGTVDIQFTPAPGASLGTTRLSLDVATLFRTWYESAAAAPFGSLFTLTMPFAVQGDVNAVRSVAVAISNGDGDSQRMEAVLSP